MSFNPGTDEELEVLVKMGRENARMWAKYIGLDMPLESDNKLMNNFILNSSDSINEEKD